MTLSVVLDQVGVASFNAEISIQFVGDANTYSMNLVGLRFYLPFMLASNWASSISVSRKYLTSVFNGFDSSQARKALRKHPILSMSGSLMFAGIESSAQAWQFMRSRARGQNIVPLYPDEQQLTASSTTNELFFDTRYRRYYEGGLVMVVKYKDDLTVDYYDVLRITTVEDDKVVTETAVTNSYSAGDYVYPGMACYPSFGADTQGMETDRIGTLSVSADEVYAETTLGKENPNYTPTVKNSLPIFNFDTNWSSRPSMSVTTQ